MAAFTTDDANASRRIPLSACLGKDLQGVEFEYPVYASADYTTPSSTVKVVANDDISAKSGDTAVIIAVIAMFAVLGMGVALKARKA